MIIGTLKGYIDVDATTDKEEPTRRDFIHIASGTAVVVGTGFFAWPLIDQMNPAADTLSLATIDFDVSDLEEGQQVVAKWQGKPVFIRYRTKAEIAEADAVDLDDLKDPQTDNERLIAGPDGKLKPEYLVTIGICTHLGCVPLFDPNDEKGGEYRGWFCPCQGSHYDNSGRIRKGPAPTNLEIPPYRYMSDTLLQIGTEA